MIGKKIKIERITLAGFRSFGRLIEFPGRQKASSRKNLWHVVVRQPKQGWRIAYLVVRDRSIARLEKHPGSLESFEPVAGKGVLFVASGKDLSCIRAFLLDRPVVLKKGLWHGIVAKGRECDVKITENSRVACAYWRLPFNLSA